MTRAKHKRFHTVFVWDLEMAQRLALMTNEERIAWMEGRSQRVSLPMELVTDARISPLAVRAYGVLLYYAGGKVGGVAKLDAEFGAEKINRSVDQWGDAVRELERAGYISNLSKRGKRAEYQIGV